MLEDLVQSNWGQHNRRRQWLRERHQGRRVLPLLHCQMPRTAGIGKFRGQVDFNGMDGHWYGARNLTNNRGRFIHAVIQ
jgi:hypothetical protein